MSTCPNCGAKVSPDDVFCQNCGYRLKPAATSTNEAAADQSDSRPEPQPAKPEPTPTEPKPAMTAPAPKRNKRRKKRSHKKAIWISLIVIVILILAGTYFYGAGKYSKSKQVDDMVTAMHDNDTAATVNYMTTTDPNLDINAKSIKPFMSYLNSDKGYLADMKTSLMANNQTSDGTFKLVTKGHHLLVFPDYKLEVVAMYPTVQTNLDQAPISINGLDVATANNDHYSYKAGPLFPGRYNFKSFVPQTDATSRSVTKNLVSTQSKNIKVDLSTPDSTDSSGSTNQAADTNDNNDNSSSNDSNNSDDSTPSDSNYGHFEEEYHGDEQAGIDAIADQYGFDYDDYTYIVSWPHKDVLQVKAYNKDDHSYDSTYRYDQIHDISSQLDESSGKFKE
ncbi:zinc ribbon domain-containing protein [Secundilactobacillus hailunensis]|uniref:Zinc ribbon domain-containing protein n=1 Tax=Secundilactobacillus hailunensis TaxID=2559923 RepID=A0ABW1TCG6_9LACO|nr:zinc ribbon domain-containing protein [Secundilactobacillus hailunensis]